MTFLVIQNKCNIYFVINVFVFHSDWSGMKLIPTVFYHTNIQRNNMLYFIDQNFNSTFESKFDFALIEVTTYPKNTITDWKKILFGL